MSNELERVARVIRPWLSQTMQDPDDWSETRARDIAADVIAHALTPTPDVGVLAEEKRRAGLLESGIVVDDLLAYGKGDGMVYVPAGLLKAAIEAIGDAWEEGLAASGVAQAFAPDQLVNPYREAGR